MSISILTYNKRVPLQWGNIPVGDQSRKDYEKLLKIWNENRCPIERCKAISQAIKTIVSGMLEVDRDLSKVSDRIEVLREIYERASTRWEEPSKAGDASGLIERIPEVKKLISKDFEQLISDSQTRFFQGEDENERIRNEYYYKLGYTGVLSPRRVSSYSVDRAPSP